MSPHEDARSIQRSSERTVRLLSDYQPRGEVEWHLHAALANGPLPLVTLLDRVVERIMCDEIAHGGWVDDIGLWGWSLYRSDVASLIRRLNGVMLAVEE